IAVFDKLASKYLSYAEVSSSIPMAVIRVKLNEIGKAVIKYFKGNKSKIYPAVKSFLIKPSDLIYHNPLTRKKESIKLLLSGYEFRDESKLPLAVSGNLNGIYYAVLENGEVRSLTLDQYEIIKDNFPADLDISEITSLIQQLGHENRKNRQLAKTQILEAGAGAIAELYKFRNHEDPEIKKTSRKLLSSLTQLAKPKRKNILVKEDK
ncbi:MAG: hypothetical protein HRT88_13860, partial [Lentisphaeraceae bacterium]|nr:hypothetical protein [Lentisphaeraceae bacterium]